MKRIFIDGSAGTTGLRIRERLAGRKDLSCLVLAEEVRKNTDARREALNAADVAFLCLPDAAAVEAVSLVANPTTVIIDTSTAHRTSEGWAYGFPELTGRRAAIARAKRIANPGCHASGFIALVAPLVERGLLARDVLLSAFSLTGYSGGGKKMIAAYEEAARAPADAQASSTISHSSFFISHLFAGGRQYALGQTHKHLPEMVKICGLTHAPVFSPIVVPHYSGMEVTVPLFAEQVKGGLAAVRDCYRDYYRDGVVRFAESPDAEGFLSSAKLSGSDALEVSAFGNGERMILVSRFDNLGKGASGAAIQNMNVALGCAETEGLVL